MPCPPSKQAATSSRRVRPIEYRANSLCSPSIQARDTQNAGVKNTSNLPQRTPGRTSLSADGKTSFSTLPSRSAVTHCSTKSHDAFMPPPNAQRYLQTPGLNRQEAPVVTVAAPVETERPIGPASALSPPFPET